MWQLIHQLKKTTMVSEDEIKEFLEGNDPEKYIVSVEYDYRTDCVYKVIEDPVSPLVAVSVVAVKSPTCKSARVYPVPLVLTIVVGATSKPSKSFQVESLASLKRPVYSVAPPSDKPSS